MYGGAIMSDAGLIASSDYTGFAKHESVTAYTTSGNVRTFFTSAPTAPFVVICPAANVAVGILAIRSTAGGYYIDVISDGHCTIIVFVVLTGAPSGFGLAFFDGSGNPTYISSRKMLALKSLGLVSAASSMAALGDAVSYSAAHLYGTTSQSEQTLIVGGGVDAQYIPVNTYVCGMKSVFQCGFRTSWDGTSSYQCWTEDQYVCEWQMVNTWVYTNYQTWAQVRKTDWNIYRGAAFFSGGAVVFRWVLHKSGYFKDILNSWTNSQTSTPHPLTASDIVAAYQNSQYSGELTSGSTFPYTNVTHNLVATNAATLTKADYV